MTPEHDDDLPEPAVLRVAGTATATVLAVVVLGGMPLLVPAGLLLGGVVVQAALVGTRGVARRRLALLAADRSYRWHQLVAAWSVQAGLTWLVAGDPTTTSALVYLACGLVFAVLLVGFLAVMDRRAPGDLADPPAEADDAVDDEVVANRPTDTAPLPVGP